MKYKKSYSEILVHYSSFNLLNYLKMTSYNCHIDINMTQLYYNILNTEITFPSTLMLSEPKIG